MGMVTQANKKLGRGCEIQEEKWKIKPCLTVNEWKAKKKAKE